MHDDAAQPAKDATQSAPEHTPSPESPDEASGLWAEVRALYLTSRKPSDIFWNVYVARPIAALALVVLRRTALTPNQVTFLGLFVFLAVPALLALVPAADGWGFFAAAVALELSYVLDCADGQLARLKSMTSDVGAYLDFLIDEIKAMLLIGGVALHLWRWHGGDTMWLLVGLAGVVAVSSATSLTTFMRRPEYAGEEIKPGVDVRGPGMPTGSIVARLVWLFVRTARFVVHYPSWILALAVVGVIVPGVEPARVFLAAYLGAIALYLGRTSLAVLLRLASPRFYAKNRAESEHEDSSA